MDTRPAAKPPPVEYRCFPIDDMPGFRERLGKARTDRVRYASSHTMPRPPSPRNTPNPLLDYMQRRKAYDGHPVDDIIVGISRLDHHSRSGGTSIPLSVTRLYNILQCMDVINTQEIRYMLGVDTRQAQKYLKAIKLCLFHIQKYRQRKQQSLVPEQVTGINQHFK